MNIRRVRYKDIEQVPQLRINKRFKQDFQGSAPAPFVGRYGYPNVNLGILSPQFVGDVSEYDSPRLWSKESFQIGQVASIRYGLVNSRTKWSIKDLYKDQLQSGKRFFETCQEVGMATKAAEIEVALKKPPKLDFKPEKEIIPYGPASEILKARIAGSPRVDTRVEKVVYDTDLKAASGVVNLYKKGFEENYLTRLLSVGTLGLQERRKLVPTRWSITAVDDTIGKELINEVKQFPVGEYRAYFGGGWGNFYLLLFFPEVWSYELFETYLHPSGTAATNPWSKQGYMYSTDHESYVGRKNYAEETAGGYYACRISVAEKMKELKRQGSCLALRFITPEYNIPLGVWVCRQATRKALEKQPLVFDSEELMMAFARSLIERKFGFKLDFLLKESQLLKQKKEQTKLAEFV
ncbi:hypothetical protein COV20_00975 [Candidatus Woesearchaeota archaeon CG10_big_fil_rev_8_21_14_0_10_45_16]|nr:MAG: hypothetical protein COV20_00975 [Candidatus Woesearchaeota archaeon CG10_big_fil_rev_8_21_14_0_10_45_16]